MTLNQINLETPEGKLLFAALTVLTTTEELMILRKVVKGTETTPDGMLDLLEQVSEATKKANLVAE